MPELCPLVPADVNKEVSKSFKFDIAVLIPLRRVTMLTEALRSIGFNEFLFMADP